MIKNMWEKIKPGIAQVLNRAGSDADRYGDKALDYIIVLITFLVLSAVFAAVTFVIVAAGGLETIIAQQMAAACINNPGVPCDYQLLLATVGMTLVLITSWSIYFFRTVINAENSFNAQDTDPSAEYTEHMKSVLIDIQTLGGVENLNALADWKGIPYTTLRRWVSQFEKDGYVTVHSNGRGCPVTVDLNG